MTDIADCYELLLQLSPSQSLAVEVLDRGGTHSEAAEAAGVDRTTVARWATRHPAFVAELGRRRLDRARSNARRLAEIDLQAIGEISAEIERGNADLALKWCKLRGFSGMVVSSGDPTDPVSYIRARVNGLPSDTDCLLQKIEGRTPQRAVKAIWDDLMGTVDLGLKTPEDWRDEFLITEPEDLREMYDDEIEELLANIDPEDPEVREHLLRLGIDPNDPKPPPQDDEEKQPDYPESPATRP
jgi:hypothetical protein